MSVLEGYFCRAEAGPFSIAPQFEKYLKTAKLGKLKKAGLAGKTKPELEAAIREKLRMSYLYNLEWVDAPTH